MDNMRGGMTTEDAGAAMAALLSGRTVGITEHPAGGWSVEMENITKSAVDLLDGQETFNYCHVETIFENDMAYYRETVMQDVPSEDGQGVILEGAYQREIHADDRINATFTGRVAYAREREWDTAKKAMEQSFAERTLEEYVNNLDYLQAGMRTVLHHMQERLPPERMGTALRLLGQLNRTMIDMGAGHAV